MTPKNKERFIPLRVRARGGLAWEAKGYHFIRAALVEDRVEPESKISDVRHLEEVFQSKCFERATRLRSLLLFLWENRYEDISEYAVAVEGLGRNPDFESKIDATVRVQIARLRVLLRRYYEGEGSRFTTRLVIPLSTHQLRLVEVMPDGEVVEESKSNPGTHLRCDTSGDVVPSSAVFPTPRGWFSSIRFLVSVLVGVIVVLLSCLSWLLLMPKHHGGKNSASSEQELPLFLEGHYKQWKGDSHYPAYSYLFCMAAGRGRQHVGSSRPLGQRVRQAGRLPSARGYGKTAWQTCGLAELYVRFGHLRRTSA